MFMSAPSNPDGGRHDIYFADRIALYRPINSHDSVDPSPVLAKLSSLSSFMLGRNNDETSFMETDN
jgi:hypothetical protein